MNTTAIHALGNSQTDLSGRLSQLPPLWVLPYVASIFAADIAGSSTDRVGGVNVEHVLLGAALGLAVISLVFEGNSRRIDGLGRILKYLSLFGLAIFLGFLSSIHPGPKIVGASTLIYWCGLTVSIGVAALAALRGHTRWVLAAIALAGIPVAASVLTPFFPILGCSTVLAHLNPARGGRISGVYWDPNNTGFALYCSLAGCLALFFLIRRSFVKLLCVLLYLVYVIVVALTLSRAALLLTALTTVVFLYITLWKTRYRWHMIVLVCVFAGIVGHSLYRDVPWRQIQKLRVLDASIYEGDTFRLRGLLGAARGTGRILFLGEGTDQFVRMSHIYLQDITLPHIRIYGKGAHAQILQVWVEWGLLALILIYSAHAHVLFDSVRHLRFKRDGLSLMLPSAYLCVLMNLQFNCVNTPASCALIGLCAGSVWSGRRNQGSERLPLR
jgi:O-antigen ligase